MIKKYSMRENLSCVPNVICLDMKTLSKEGLNHQRKSRSPKPNLRMDHRKKAKGWYSVANTQNKKEKLSKGKEVDQLLK